MRIAVTGANGFLGGHLVRALLSAGAAVTAVAREPDGLASLVACGAEPVTTDYGADSIARWIAGHDAVVHLGARRMGRADPPRGLEPFVEPNLLLPERIADAAIAAGVGRLVFASSIAVYSAVDPVPFVEDGPTHPINAYGLAKLMGEELLELKCRGTRTDALSLRFAALYGVGERTTGVFMKFASEAAEGRDLTIKGNAGYGVDLLYVDDAVAALIAAATTAGARGVVNVGGGKAWTVGEMARIVAAAHGGRVAVHHEDPVEGPAPQPHMAIDRAARVLNWAPRHDLASGLAAMVAQTTATARP